MVSIDQQLGTAALAALQHIAQSVGNLARLEEHGGGEHRRRALVQRPEQSVPERARRPCRDSHDVHALLAQTRELASHAVKLTVGGDQLRPLTQWQS